MTWQTLLAIMAGLVSAAANLPYLRAVRRRVARPRLATWLIFAGSTGVAAAGSLLTWQLASGLVTAALSAGCCAVVVTGWRHGDRRIRRSEIVCLALACAGVALLAAGDVWPQTVPGLWALVVAVATDLLAFGPTYVNGWRGAEPWFPFAVFTVGAVGGLAAADWSVPAALLWPTYLVIADAAMVVVVLASPHRPLSAFTLRPRVRRVAVPQRVFAQLQLHDGGTQPRIGAVISSPVSYAAIATVPLPEVYQPPDPWPAAFSPGGPGGDYGFDDLGDPGEEATTYRPPPAWPVSAGRVTYRSPAGGPDPAQTARWAAGLPAAAVSADRDIDRATMRRTLDGGAEPAAAAARVQPLASSRKSSYTGRHRRTGRRAGLLR